MVMSNRTVIGGNSDKKSEVLYQDSTNDQDTSGVTRRSTLWASAELPIDNSIKGDRAVDVTVREPEGDGMIFRVNEIPPDMKDKKKHIQMMKELNEKVKQKDAQTDRE